MTWNWIGCVCTKMYVCMQNILFLACINMILNPTQVKTWQCGLDIGENNGNCACQCQVPYFLFSILKTLIMYTHMHAHTHTTQKKQIHTTNTKNTHTHIYNDSTDTNTHTHYSQSQIHYEHYIRTLYTCPKYTRIHHIHTLLYTHIYIPQTQKAHTHSTHTIIHTLNTHTMIYATICNNVSCSFLLSSIWPQSSPTNIPNGWNIVEYPLDR